MTPTDPNAAAVSEAEVRNAFDAFKAAIGSVLRMNRITEGSRYDFAYRAGVTAFDRLLAEREAMRAFLSEIGWTRDYGQSVLNGKGGLLAPEDFTTLRAALDYLPLAASGTGANTK